MYSKWGKGNWGMIITGNMQISKEHLSLGRDIVIPTEHTPENMAPFRQLADAIHAKESGSDINGRNVGP